MLKLNFLTAPLGKVARDFLTPIILNRKRLAQLGFSIRFCYRLNDSLLDCDILCVVSSYVRRHKNDPKQTELLKEIMQKATACYFFDINDSTGALYTEFIPLSDRYYKKQLLKDRNLYLEELYNKRPVPDYYYRKFDIHDSKVLVGKNLSQVSDLKKLRLSWNVGLGDYKIYPRAVRFLMNKSLKLFFDPTIVKIINIEKERDIDILCCFSLYKGKAGTIQFHRKKTMELIRKMPANYLVKTGLYPPKEYFALLKNSKISVCPLGWGEISWKDYESFVRGVVVAKPDMSFMETWPDYYQGNITYLPYKWDFSDMLEKIFELLKDDEKRRYIAATGQKFYRNTINERGKEEFCRHFVQIIGL